MVYFPVCDFSFHQSANAFICLFMSISAALCSVLCVVSSENQCLSAVISNQCFILFIDLMTPFVNSTVKVVSTVGTATLLKAVISLLFFSLFSPAES